MGMSLPITEQGFGDAEDHSWLGSAHGTESTLSATLDDDEFLAIFTDGIVPSGVILVKDGDLAIPRAGAAGEGTNAVIKLTPASSGNTTLTFQGDDGPGATNLGASVDAAMVTAVEALLVQFPDIDPGDFEVTLGSGGDAGKIIITAAEGGAWDNRPVPTFGVSGTGTAISQSGGAAATAGEGALGHLISMATLTAGGNTVVAYMDHGRVRVDNLPDNSGWDDNVPNELPHIRYQV